ncbi:hypothetical protein O1E20_001887 [Vibrio cholerae]|uniref:hypothetical protein n=1 Tax=Vibrio cholerae TaxID=666 RepID=UPI0011D4C92C|nr:hypothetical protein [Vibrio cholerae]TXY68055.1 hypothetical protein FXE88_00235 [Vibrio cholerae]GHX28399.1 hypothetical protein VCSRO107_3151 [Vibrio cholerae]
MRIFYTLTTLEPVIISRSSATTQHQTLDHIPGSALLGAVASKLYPQLSTEDAFTLFHSGECRFSPAYPVVTDSDNPQYGEIALPAPASWHTQKGEKNDLSNHAARRFVRDELTQYQQIRQGFISSARTLQYAADIRTGLTARTALDSETQRAKEGQLFQYAFIQAEQTFAGWVDCAEPALAILLQHTLHGEFVLGRSRNSEFGKVSLSLYQPQTQPQPAAVRGNDLVIWCLSDMACLDAFGQPTLTPSAQDLHPELCGDLDPTRTFIRSRRVRRFNRARGGLNSEQLLIAAGSVLTYQLQDAPTEQALHALTEQGCGFAREQGLGWVMVNPAWAEQEKPGTGAGELFTPLAVTLPQPPVLHERKVNHHTTSSPLLAWVQSKQAKQKRNRERKRRCQAMHDLIADAYQSLRRYHRTPPAYQAGPSSSQWRRLADLARSSHADRVHQDGILDWRRAAFEAESAICKTNNDPSGWGIEWPEGDRLVTFAQQFDAAIKRHQLDLDDLRLLLEELCRYDLSTDEGLRAYRKKYTANSTTHHADNQQEAGQ